MSLSMWLWRLIIPGAGLALCAAVGWQTLRAPEAAAKADGAKKPAARSISNDRVIAEGRIAARPGAEVTIGTELGGVVVALPAREKFKVKKGDLLIAFRDDDRQAALDEAKAKLDEIDAEVEFQKREYQRRVKTTGTPSKNFTAEVDMVRRDYEVAAARRRAAEAAVTQCRSALERMKIHSPIDGVVLDCRAVVGETVPPGARLVTVCDLARTRVEAEVDEFDAPRVALGAEVLIRAEGYPGAPWKGTVEEIPDRVADRSLRPEDPGRPSDLRVLLVKVTTPQRLPLKLGQQVEVEIRVRPKGKE